MVSVMAYLTTQLHKFFAIRVHDMNGAGDTRIEAVDRSLDLQRLFRIVEGVTIHERRLIGTGLALLRRADRHSRLTAPPPGNCRSFCPL